MPPAWHSREKNSQGKDALMPADAKAAALRPADAKAAALRPAAVSRRSVGVETERRRRRVETERRRRDS